MGGPRKESQRKALEKKGGEKEKRGRSEKN